MSGSAVSTDGLLDVELVRARDGRTRVGTLRQRFPQRVTAPMYLDDDAPATAYLCVQNPTGGIFPGDRLDTRITAAAGTGLQLTSQSATQVYPGSGAEHHYALTLAEGAVVEHVPRTTVPHRDSTYQQSTALSLTGDAVYLGWEAVAAGRIGHGERFAFDSYRAVTIVECDGDVVARETVVLEPGRVHPDAPGRMAGHAYLASVLVVAPRRPGATADLAATLARRFAAEGEVVGAASVLPDDVGVTVRVLADRAPALQAALLGVWQAAREIVLQRNRLPRRV